MGGTFLFVSAFAITTYAYAESITSISIVPDLDISRFSTYVIEAETSGSPTSVSVEISGINGDGGSEWDYYVDGTPASAAVTKTMTYDTGSGKWISASVYPDSIYPEIFFAPSTTTWNNAPSNIIARRNNYHLLHFANPFTMTGSMSFFVEINAVPRSTVNSADMEVYLVKNAKEITFFNSDWRNSADVQLIADFSKSATYNHEHSANSGHHLIPLRTNTGGTIGTIGEKEIDVSGDFWLILYVNSPNDARGWDLKYQDSSLCTSSNRWYIGSQAGWTTTAQTGCPDAHIHVARRALTYLDGITATVTAQYAGGTTAASTDTFYFASLPNLAPNTTSFISPVPNGVYDGGATETLTVSWNPAIDPNDGESVDYTITLLSSTGAEILPALATATGATSFDWSIAAVADGTYGLKGEACDNNASSLCTEFLLDGTFVIEKVAPIYALSAVTIASDNADTSIAKAGDTVTLSFTASGDISPTASVAVYSGGQEVTNAVTLDNSGNNWTATYVVSASDTDGIVDFSITADNLDFLYAETTDDSYVTIDVTAPGTPTASPAAGTYTSAQTVALSANGSTRILFTIDGTDPTCSSGNLYGNTIPVATYTLLKVVACDAIGNVSDVATLAFTITGAATATGEYGASGGRRGSGTAAQSRYEAESTMQSPHNASIGITPAGTRTSLFADVPASHPQAEAIYTIVDKGGITGITNELFRPKKSLTRAEAVNIVLALRGITPDPAIYKDCFPDVSTANICYAKDAGLVSGFLGGEFEGLFKPDFILTREQAAAILLRALQPDILPPKGQEEYWYARYITAARRSGVLREILRRRVNRGSFIESAYRLHGASKE